MSDPSLNERPEEAQDPTTAAERLLRSLRDHGVEYLFANYGTDHTPILEAAARVREEDPEAIPEYVICPHEVVALSAAHGYAAVTGEPQAVVVHVDVGTQNLGAMLHDAHRGDAPVFIISGLAPVSEGDHPGARDHYVHYLQDVFDQPGIVRQYCRWVTEYQPPADPDAVVARGLERARAPPGGPVYVTATREALETPVTPSTRENRSVRTARASGADPAAVGELADMIADAETPLVITSKFAVPPADSPVESLVEFAETAGAGIVEFNPEALNFPRDHDLHAGFDSTAVFETADLLVLAAVDVPWVPTRGRPPADLPVVQVDIDPTKSTYPHWDFPIDHTVRADPEATLSAVADRLDPDDGDRGRLIWEDMHAAQLDERERRVTQHRKDERLTPEVVTDAIADLVDESTVVVDEAVTNSGVVQSHIPLSRPGSYYASHGSGLGWCGGAPIGVKMARPDERVIAIVGDGSYVFANPTATAWVSAAQNAPTLTVVYNNSGWGAVKDSTLGQHPDESAATADVPESKFSPPLDLTAAAHVVDAHTATIDGIDHLTDELRAGIDAVDAGKPAVLDVKIESI